MKDGIITADGDFVFVYMMIGYVHVKRNILIGNLERNYPGL